MWSPTQGKVASPPLELTNMLLVSDWSIPSILASDWSPLDRVMAGSAHMQRSINPGHVSPGLTAGHNSDLRDSHEYSQKQLYDLYKAEYWVVELVPKLGWQKLLAFFYSAHPKRLRNQKHFVYSRMSLKSSLWPVYIRWASACVVDLSIPGHYPGAIKTYFANETVFITPRRNEMWLWINWQMMRLRLMWQFTKF